VITSCTIASELVGQSRLLRKPSEGTYVYALIHIQVGVHIALVCAPDSASHAGPWLLDGQNSLDIVSVNLLSGDRVDDSRLDTEERQRCATGLGRSNASQGRDDVGPCLCLPVRLPEYQYA